MVGREQLLGIIERALAVSPGDETEVLVTAEDSYLTRFAANHIHQNVGERDARLQVRVVLGQRIGRASTNSLSEESVRSTVATASEIARLQRPNPEFRALPDPGPVRTVLAWDEGTAECPAARRADAVRAIVDRAEAKGLVVAGSFSTGANELAVGNSRGVRAYHPFTKAALTCVAMSGESSGYAGGTHHDCCELNPEALADEAIGRCLAGKGAQALEPGEYTVILESYAVATLIGFLARLAFSARAYQEGRSPLVGKLGTRIVSDKVDIWDDGLDPRGMPLPFDFEGVPKRRLELISHGVAQGLVHDSMTAGKEGKQSTGHATPGGFGPMPMNLFLGTGDSTVEDMVRGTERGLLVTRFHYANPVHPVRTIITGMTRDGTFLVEKGQVKHAVRNLRFTQSILEALANVEGLGKKAHLSGGRAGGLMVPALKLGRFTFTGVTEF